MSVLVAERIERPLSLFGAEPERSAASAPTGERRRHDGVGGGRTLDEAIVGAWEGLAARAAVACPLCGGALRPRPAGDAPGGRCGDCGTTLT
jgi:hypothetical protein